MKFFALILLLSSSVFAAEPKMYELNTEVFLKGKKFGPTVSNVKENVPTKVTQKTDDGDVELEITVAPKKNGAVESLLMKFLITSSTKGVRALVGQPQILAGENQKATITMGPKGKPPTMVLTVIGKTKKAATAAGL